MLSKLLSCFWRCFGWSKGQKATVSQIDRKMQVGIDCEPVIREGTKNLLLTVPTGASFLLRYCRYEKTLPESRIRSMWKSYAKAEDPESGSYLCLILIIRCPERLATDSRRLQPCRLMEPFCRWVDRWVAVSLSCSPSMNDVLEGGSTDPARGIQQEPGHRRIS
jgi:hypothetical protein